MAPSKFDDLFITATQKKFRFQSIQGKLTVEDLWDLPLQSRRPNGACLDDVAIALSRQLKAATEESFVVKVAPEVTLLEQKLEIVKHVISVKLAQINDKKDAALKAERKRQLEEVLVDKRRKVMAEMSVEEIEKELKGLASR